MVDTRTRFVAQAAALALTVLLVACGGAKPLPSPGASQGTPPDLRGRRVIVLPVQQNVGVPGNPDAELAFGLTSRSSEVDWTMPDEIEQALARAPAIQARTRGLPVGVFLRAEVDRVGDPLYGEIRRMSSLVDADVVLIPVGVSARTVGAEDPRVAVTAALVVARTGRVAWFGVVEGDPFPVSDPRGLASAMDALARTLLWYVGG